MAEAAGVTFYALLALFPAIASFISLYGLLTDPASLNDQLRSLQGVVPGGGLDIIRQQVTALTESSGKALGFGAIIGILTSLWSANAGVKSLFDALNVVYHEHEKRSLREADPDLLHLHPGRDRLRHRGAAGGGGGAGGADLRRPGRRHATCCCAWRAGR